MDKNEEDGWLASLLDIQLETTKKAVEECNRLRRRVRELEGQVAGGMASDLTALQDRVTQLEGLLRNNSGFGGGDGR